MLGVHSGRYVAEQLFQIPIRRRKGTCFSLSYHCAFEVLAQMATHRVGARFFFSRAILRRIFWHLIERSGWAQDKI